MKYKNLEVMDEGYYQGTQIIVELGATEWDEPVMVWIPCTEIGCGKAFAGRAHLRRDLDSGRVLADLELLGDYGNLYPAIESEVIRQGWDKEHELPIIGKIKIKSIHLVDKPFAEGSHQLERYKVLE